MTDRSPSYDDLLAREQETRMRNDAPNTKSGSNAAPATGTSPTSNTSSNTTEAGNEARV